MPREVLVEVIDDGVYRFYEPHTGDLIEDLGPPITSPGNGGEFAIPDYKNIPLTWKQKGTSSHPVIANGDMTASAFVLGHFARIEAKVHFGSDTFLGGGPDPTHFWYFQFPSNLMPDFTDSLTVEATGSCHIYTGGGMVDGTSYWTRNVGSGIDGVKISANFLKDIGPNTRAWKRASKSDGSPDGDSIRFALSYRRKSNTT